MPMEEKAENANTNSFIGVFDSGTGGISVLRALVAELPHEHFHYFGDSAHAPYGDLGAKKIQELSFQHTQHFLDEGAKAIVIACNTATSAAAAALRETWPRVPIVGIEPALKPAAQAGGRILVLATEATVHLDKYHELAKQFGAADITTVACSGLVELVEAGDLKHPTILEYLQDKIGQFQGQVDSVVLGCTHYPFLKPQLTEVLGHVTFFDGAEGTARYLHKRLKEENLLAPDAQAGSVQFASSIPEQVELYQRLFTQAV